MDTALSLWLRNWNFSQEAEKLVTEQLEIRPDDVQLLANALMISIGSKNRADVGKYIAKIRKIDPARLEIKKSIGFLAYQDQDSEEAIVNWKEVIRRDPRDVGTIRNLNKIYKQQQLWPECYRLLKQGL